MLTRPPTPSHVRSVGVENCNARVHALARAHVRAHTPHVSLPPPSPPRRTSDGVLIPQDSAFLEVWDLGMVLALAIIIVMLPYTVAFLDFPKFDGSDADNAGM